MLLGIYEMYFVYSYSFLVVVVNSLLVYLICVFAGKNAGGIVFFETMAFMSYYHIARDDVDVEISMAIMMALAKWQSFAYNFVDGLNKVENEFKLDKLPNIFEYFSYILHYCGAVMGPFYEYEIYDNYIKNNEYTPTFKQAMKTFGVASIFIVLYGISGNFPINAVLKEEFN